MFLFVQETDNTVQWINHCPADKSSENKLHYPVGKEGLSSERRHLSFRHPASLSNKRTKQGLLKVTQPPPPPPPPATPLAQPRSTKGLRDTWVPIVDSATPMFTA